MLAVSISAMHLAFFLKTIKLKQFAVGLCYITLLECVT